MPMIDRWVVSQALGTLAHYRDDGDPRSAYTLSINLSGTSLNDDRFLEFLINELQGYDLSPGAVCFEITETAAISNLPNVVHFMKEFRARGCRPSATSLRTGRSICAASIASTRISTRRSSARIRRQRVPPCGCI